MVAVDPGKDDSKQPLLSRGNSQETAPPPSYSAANAAGPSNSSATYARVANQPPPAPAQGFYVAPTPGQLSYQHGAHQTQYVQYSATPPVAHRPGYVYTYHPVGPPPPPQEPAWKRFFKALGVAALVWFLFSMLMTSIADRIPSIIGRLGEPTYPVAADGDVQECYGHGLHGDSAETDERWNEVPSDRSWSRRASLDLDLGKAKNAAFYLLTRGGSTTGTVELEEGSSENVGVRVVVDYDPRLYATDKVWQVCVLERNGERGVGIYFPDYSRGRGSIPWRRFDVRAIITLPKETHIAKFSTDTRNYAHVLNIGKDTTFNSLRLRGTNARVEAKSLVTATSLDASTTNGRISGSYSGSTLTLTTTNSVISGTYNASSLTLKTTNGAVDTDTTVGRTVSITTSNAPIRGPISFIGKSGAFDATVYTSNGAVEVRVPTLPSGAALSLNSRTSNAGSSIMLPATFEGRIWQYTSNSGTPSLAVGRDLRDPTGRGREHVVTSIESRKGQREDRVGWGNDSGAGHVRMKTSNGASGVRIVQEP